jgi:hypothetical protein
MRIPRCSSWRVRSYSSGETQVFDVRGGSRRQTNRQWPNVRLNSGSITIPQFMQAYVSRLNFSTSYARTRQEASQEGGGAETSGHNNTVPLQVSLGLGRRLNASYSASFAWGSSRDLTGYMDSRNRSHSANLSGSFNAPEHLRETFRNPITMNARVQMQRGLRCRVRSQTGDDTCVPFLDDRSRSVGLSLDTLLEDLIVGFRLDYTSRESFVGMQSGSSQFQVGLYGQFNFSAGNFTGIGR